MLTTTINMHCTTRERIIRAAGLKESKQRDIVVLLLKRIMRDIDRLQGGFTLVKYQPADPEKRWHCFCLQIREDENEFFTDMRKLCKITVSHLLAIAVRLYLDELLRMPHDELNNYLNYINYFISQEQVEGLRCWIYYWGNPKNPKKTHPRAKKLRTTADNPSRPRGRPVISHW
ncbi:MAG: hypothetical protein EPN93_05770 [Spirochaetes bacterium]|nr:MAG: hypothetical protein EPN93_05770 [Spirochaetota bacterium]